MEESGWWVAEGSGSPNKNGLVVGRDIVGISGPSSRHAVLLPSTKNWRVVADGKMFSGLYRLSSALSVEGTSDSSIVAGGFKVAPSMTGVGSDGIYGKTTVFFSSGVETMTSVTWELALS
jgi:hypothetical protein